MVLGNKPLDSAFFRRLAAIRLNRQEPGEGDAPDVLERHGSNGGETMISVHCNCLVEKQHVELPCPMARTASKELLGLEGLAKIVVELSNRTSAVPSPQ